MGKLRKQPAYARVHEEEKYKFIKEQIRPQRKRYIIHFTRKILETVISAIIFGGVAGIVFWNVNNGLGGSQPVQDRGITAVESPALAQSRQANTAVPANNNNAGTDAQTKSSDDLTVLEESNMASKRLSAVGERFADSLVSIVNKKNKPVWPDEEINSAGAVSGMLLKETAMYYYILASGDLAGLEVIDVEFEDGEMVKAAYVASDSSTGLSVFCIEKGDVSEKRRNKIVIPEFGSTISIPTGSNIIIAGAPNGVMYSVMTGNIIKSGIEMPITDNVISLFATDILYTSSANGIVLNTKGRVIGFVTNSYERATGSNNIGFIGISSILGIINSMVKGENIPYLGISGYDVDKTTAAAHNISEGIYLTSVYSGSPAYSGGIRVADVITQIDGRDVVSLSVLHNILKDHDAGDRISVTVSRKSGKKNSSKKLIVRLE
ncbi:MAG: serine protease [Lachnospiraceae bacterium]|nr:serine protease [Lachnospiraceae bacterium]